MSIQQSYKKICTEFYDIIKPDAKKKEVSFYDTLLRPLHGPVLEAMCGSGRLLVPLLEHGYTIDGVDYSTAMLEQCKKRLYDKDLLTELYLQDIQSLSLSKKYAAIIVAYGSFQLLYPKENALQALRAFKKHLQPGGMLILDIFIPWNFINSEETSFYSSRQVQSSNSTIFLTSRGYLDKEKQTYTTLTNYQKKSLNHLEIEEEERVTTWYENTELQNLLKQAGFTSVTVQTISFQPGDESIIYITS